MEITASGTPLADTSTAGEWYNIGVRIFDGHNEKIAEAKTPYDASNTKDAHNASLAALRERANNWEERADDLRKEAAALREQLAQKERDYVELKRGMWKRLNETTEKVEQQQAALKQKDEAIDYAAAELQQHLPMSHAITVLDEARRIHPDSTALKTVIEAKTAKLRELILRYLASDGSFGYYIADELYETREELKRHLQVFCAEHLNDALAASAQKAGQP